VDSLWVSIILIDSLQSRYATIGSGWARNNQSENKTLAESFGCRFESGQGNQWVGRCGLTLTIDSERARMNSRCENLQIKESMLILPPDFRVYTLISRHYFGFDVGSGGI